MSDLNTLPTPDDQPNIDTQDTISDESVNVETAENLPEQSPDTPPKFSLAASVLDYIEIVVFSVCAVLICFTLFGRLCSVSGSSMLNTLHDRELLLTTSMGEIEPGDIIVFHQTSDLYPRFNEPLVKRVIATEGQVVRIDYNTGEVSVDGTVIDEPYAVFLDPFTGKPVDGPTSPPGHHYDHATKMFEATVPEGCYFVMGDNRNNSADSRSVEVGFVDTRRVLGKVAVRLKPFATFD